jgi:hypothetical protein
MYGPIKPNYQEIDIYYKEIKESRLTGYIFRKELLTG